MAVTRVFASTPAFALAAGLWLSGMSSASAESACAPSGEPGVERCVSGLPIATLSAMFEPQQASNWCWAASVAMILRRYGVAIPQEQVVRTAFGLAANEGASVRAIADLLNRGWDDARGHALVASARLLPPWRRSFGLAAPEVLDDLAQGKPLLVGVQRHAMVLVQVIYERRVDGQPLTMVGVRMVSATVLDPASYEWLRALRAAELQPDFLARVDVHAHRAAIADANAPAAQLAQNSVDGAPPR